LARSINRNYFLFPQTLFISGQRAPQLLRDERPLHGLPDDQFIEALKQYNGTPEEVLRNQELLQVFLPILRADFCLGDTYQHEVGEKLRVDVVLYGGKGDAIVPERDLLAWQDVFDGDINYHSFDGDHFFIHHSRGDVISSMKKILAPARSTDRHAVAPIEVFGQCAG
ncbi:MAG: thioesterase II family protein, partial [Gammaproteobacteria bacterium]